MTHIRIGDLGRAAAVCLLSLVAMAAHGYAVPAVAHFDHFQPRVVHISEAGGLVHVRTRLPAPLLLLPEDWRGGDSGQDIAFTTRWHDGEMWQYRLDRTALESGVEQLSRRILKTHRIEFDGVEPESVRVTAVSVFATHDRKPFSTLESAREALSGGQLVVAPGEIDFFDAVIDFEITVSDASLGSPVALASALGEHLVVIESLANVVHLHRRDGTVMHTTVGPLNAGFEGRTALLSQMISQIGSGLFHILSGIDHLLIVALIAIAAPTWIVVLRNATGFTLGHSATLALGAYGFAPQVAWFVPLVELVIAATIVHAAAAIALRKPEMLSLPIVTLVGLVHGFGFSFVLNEVLVEGGGIGFVDFAFFNLGIELGQIAVYLGIAPLIFIVERTVTGKGHDWRRPVSAAFALVAALWILDRGEMLLEVL